MPSVTPLPFLSGVVEGYYGPVWSVSDTASVMTVMQQDGLNTFVYAPKDDAYARSLWYELYPSAQLAQLQALVSTAASHHIRFVYSVSPGLDIVYSSATDREELLAKVRQVAALGVQTFMLSFDDTSTTLQNSADLSAYPGGLGEAQSELANWLIAQMGTTSGFHLLFTPTYYYGMTDGPYWEDLHRYLAVGVPVLWTGPSVLSASITSSEAETFASDVGHPVIVWDNYPVNDYTYQQQHAPRLFLGPLQNRSATLPTVLAGYLANPMQQADASLVALITVADYLARPASYVPATAWSTAVAEVGAGAEPAFQLLAQDCSSSFLTGGQTMSSLPSDISAYWANPAGSASSTLTAAFTGMAGESTALSSLQDQALYQEVQPWAQELSAEGQDGLDALTLLADHASGADTGTALSTVDADITRLQSPAVVLDTTTPVLNFLQQAVSTAGS